VVYDAAFYPGNSALELLAVNPPDLNIISVAKYNRILFKSENDNSTSLVMDSLGIIHKP
jgi:hypothetical protein